MLFKYVKILLSLTNDIKVKDRVSANIIITTTFITRSIVTITMCDIALNLKISNVYLLFCVNLWCMLFDACSKCFRSILFICFDC